MQKEENPHKLSINKLSKWNLFSWIHLQNRQRCFSFVLMKTYLIMLLVLRIVVVFYEVMYVEKTFSLLTFSTLFLRSFEYHSDYQIKSGNFMKKVQVRSNSIHCKYLQGVTVGHKETLYLQMYLENPTIFIKNREIPVRITWVKVRHREFL